MNCEPCTSLLDQAADYSPTSSSDTGQLSLLSGMPTPAKSSENAPLMDGSPACTCGKGMSDCSIHPNTQDAWIASMRASLARIFHSLESKPGLATALDQVFTAKSCASLTSFDPDTCSWKTSQQSFLTDSEQFLETWPRAGMTCAGLAFALPMLEQIIGEIDGGRLPQWPTPSASLGEKGGLVTEKKAREGGTLIEALSARTMWPTPTTSTGGSNNNSRAVLERGHGTNLVGAVLRTWPTPRANDAEKRGNIDPTNPRNGLPAAVLKFPTPSSNDWKGSSKPGQRRGQLTDPAMGAIPAGGKLNPTWVGWLMGVPIGFTSLEHWVMPKSRCKPLSPGDCSPVNPE